jgi:hypothetical protein
MNFDRESTIEGWKQMLIAGIKMEHGGYYPQNMDGQIVLIWRAPAPLHAEADRPGRDFYKRRNARYRQTLAAFGVDVEALERLLLPTRLTA